MGHRARLCLFLGLAAACGCSHDQTTNCEPKERYSTARSVAPVQIPDDLSPPDETDALRLPPVAAATAAAPSEACLESPPSFFGDARPGGRRATEANTGAEAPADAEPPAEADAPADAAAPDVDSERVIEN